MAVDEKNGAASEVFDYLHGNLYRYLTELLTTALEDASEDEIYELVALALGDREDFLDDVQGLNQELTSAMANKMAWVVRNINAVKGGKVDVPKKDEFGKPLLDAMGNVVLE